MHPIQALVFSLIMPWQACRQAWRGTRALPSLLYHIVGLVIFFVGLVIVDAVMWYGDIVRDFDYMGPGAFFLFAVVWAIMIELGYFFTAWWTSCWGAGVEPLRASFGRSLSRWYQLTPFHAVWTLGLLIAVGVLEEAQWHSYSGDYGSLDYQLREMLFALSFLAVFLVYCGVGGWFTLRALAVSRSSSLDAPKCRWPAVCESCGYAIVGLGYDQSCPECGRPVQASFYTPRGTPERNTLAKMRMALFNPGALGQILLSRTRTKAPAKALAITAISLLCTGPIGVTYIFVLTQISFDDIWMDDFFEFFRLFIVGGLATGLSAMVGGVSIVLGIGSLIGLTERVFGKRNNLPAACHAACYASGYVIFMALLMYGFTGALILFADRYLSHLGFGLIAVIPLTWLIVCLALTLPYCFIVGRIVRSTKYANA